MRMNEVLKRLTCDMGLNEYCSGQCPKKLCKKKVEWKWMKRPGMQQRLSFNSDIV